MNKFAGEKWGKIGLTYSYINNLGIF